MNELTLMTWNVRYFGHGLRGLRSTRRWMGRLADALASLEQLPDVVALQEVETRSLRAGLWPQTQLERFQALLEERLQGRSQRYRALYFPAHRYALRGTPALYTTGLAVLVSEELELLGHNADDPYDITHRPNVDALATLKQRRIAAHVQLCRPGGASLDLFNTHLSLPAFNEVGLHGIHTGMGRGSNQVREVQRLLHLIDGRATAEHTVVVGDFNSAPGTPAYQTLVEAGLVDAFAAHLDHDSDLLSQWNTARFGTARMHIDHVFSSDGVRWLDFAEHTASRGGPFHGLSDHVPKIGRLVLPRSSAPAHRGAGANGSF